MSNCTKQLGKAAGFLVAMENDCLRQGVENFDALLDFLTNGRGKPKEKLLGQMVRVLATGMFRDMYDNIQSHPTEVSLRAIAPLEGLKITFGQAAALAGVQWWNMLPGPQEWNQEKYNGVFKLLQRTLVPYRLVFLNSVTEDGKYHTWRPDRNLGGLVDKDECFGPQDLVILININ